MKIPGLGDNVSLIIRTSSGPGSTHIRAGARSTRTRTRTRTRINQNMSQHGSPLSLQYWTMVKLYCCQRLEPPGKGGRSFYLLTELTWNDQGGANRLVSITLEVSRRSPAINALILVLSSTIPWFPY